MVNNLSGMFWVTDQNNIVEVDKNKNTPLDKPVIVLIFQKSVTHGNKYADCPIPVQIWINYPASFYKPVNTDRTTGNRCMVLIRIVNLWTVNHWQCKYKCCDRKHAGRFVFFAEQIVIFCDFVQHSLHLHYQCVVCKWMRWHVFVDGARMRKQRVWKNWTDNLH